MYFYDICNWLSKLLLVVEKNLNNTIIVKKRNNLQINNKTSKIKF